MTSNMTRWDPVGDVVSLRDAMDRLFEDSFVRSTGLRPRNGNGAGSFAPPANIWETPDIVGVDLAIPGANRESVDVTYENGVLSIAGEMSVLDEERQWIRVEQPHGTFRRMVRLNIPLDVEDATAVYANGILQVTLPKSETVKPRKIEVATGH